MSLYPDRRRQSLESRNFTRHEDDMVVELDCVHCSTTIRFSKFARPDVMESEMMKHRCHKPALGVDLEMFTLVRCPDCAGTGLARQHPAARSVSVCGTCEHGTVLFPRAITAGLV